MDERKEHIRRQFVDSLMELVNQGIEALDEETVAELLWESLVDLDPATYRYDCHFEPRRGEPTLWICYRTAIALQRDLKTFVDVQGLMVEVEETPPLMEAMDLLVTGQGVDDEVVLRGRAVHQGHEELAVELFPVESEQQRQLEQLAESMRESSDEPHGVGSLASTFSTAVGSTIDDQQSLTEESSDVEVPVVDQLVDQPAECSRCWQLGNTKMVDMMMELATVEGYGYLEVETSQHVVQLVLHYGKLIDVRRQPAEDTEQALIDKMLSTGHIKSRDVERAQVLASIHDIPVQDALVDMGCITLEQLVDAIRGRLVDELHKIWEVDAREARLYLLEHRPPLRLRRSAIDLVTRVVDRVRRQVAQMSKTAITEYENSLSGHRVRRRRSLPFDIDRLGLGEDEQRFVEVILDEPRSVFDLRRMGNLRGEQMIRTLVILDRLKVLERCEESRRLPEHGEIEGLYDQLARSNHFEILGVHWSAYDDAVDEAYRKVQSRLDVPEAVEQDLGEKLQQLRRAVSEAYAVVSSRHSRADYRDEQIDEFAQQSALSVYRKQIDSLSMRDDKTELVDCLSRIVELAPDDQDARHKLEALRRKDDG